MGLFSCCNCPIRNIITKIFTFTISQKFAVFSKQRIFLYYQNTKVCRNFKMYILTLRKSSLQLSSSDSSKQFEVWSQLGRNIGHSWGEILVTAEESSTIKDGLSNRCSMLMHCPSLQVNSPSEQVVSLIGFTLTGIS